MFKISKAFQQKAQQEFSYYVRLDLVKFEYPPDW